MLFLARPARKEILGIPVDPLTMDQTLELTETYVQSGTFAHVIGVNADKVLQAKDDASVAGIVDACEIVNADGASMVMAGKLLGTPVPERVAGIDYMLRLCELAATKKYSVFLLGARDSIVEESAVQLKQQFPGLNILGTRDGYFSEAEYGEVAEEIKLLRPNVVFVGITSPKKEEVIEFFRKRQLTGVFVGVGGSFDVISGKIPRAPLWVQKLSLEWLYRMLQEPKRLVKRYLVGNTRFLFLLLKTKLMQGKSKQ